MASTKRKIAGVESTEKSSKRSRIDQAGAKTKTPKTFEPESTTRPKTIKDSKLSVFSQEEPAFPRGGADVLTPLERKQISAKASRDALKEHKRSQDLFTSGNATIEDSSDGSGAESATPAPKKTKATKQKSKDKKSAAKSAEEAKVSISGLNFKRIAIGSLILGRISAISNKDVTVALPNNLVGYAALTAISPQVNAKIQKLLDNDGDQAGGDAPVGEEEEDDGLNLSDYLTIGQYVRVAVTSTGTDVATAAARKRLELSLDPALVNVGLDRTSLAAGCVVQVSVSSIEDHGLVVDLSLEDYNVRGFIPTKALPAGVESSDIKIGAVILCTVVEIGSNGKIVKLSANLSQGKPLKSAASVDAFLPGTLTDILISEVTPFGIAGKIMGMIDVTADLVHTAAFVGKDEFHEKYQPGQKVRARLICTFPLSDEKTLGFSLLDHLIDPHSNNGWPPNSSNGLDISAVVADALVSAVEPKLGVYFSLTGYCSGFAHVSRLSDKKLDNVNEGSGPFKLDTKHTVRITDYNSIDDLYLVSLQKSVLDQPFLRIEDVQVGDVVKGTIEKVVVNANGVQGLVVNLATNVSGYVPLMHLSDVVLQHPEKKFREGQQVTARVLSMDLSKRQIRLTLKKTLVNNDQQIWTDMVDINHGSSAVGTLVKVEPYGAIVQFYGSVKGYLPVSEMSEAYIKDATEHFRVGQVVSVNALNVNAADQRLTVSCRDPSGTTQVSESALLALEVGTAVSGTVFEKSQNDLLLRLSDSEAIARLTLDHISDGSEKKRQSAMNKIRVGQKLEDLLILEVQARRRLVLLSNRSSLRSAAQNGQFLKSFEGLKEGILVTGYVSNVTSDGIFVSFAAGVSGLIPQKSVDPQSSEQQDFGVTKFQTITAKVSNIDYRGATPRFWLTLRDLEPNSDTSLKASSKSAVDHALINPVDETLRSSEELTVGKVTRARILSVKQTQLNVELAKDVQGRVDVSEVFDTWEDIKDRKKPLDIFSPRQIISVRILGGHDTRNHRFLPLSHRSGKSTVLELSTKPSAIRNDNYEPTTLGDLAVDSPCIAYVNNYQEGYLWVNVSPRVRGRIRAVDVSNDLSQAGDLPANFPLGSAMRTRVVALDIEKERLDLTARSEAHSGPLTIKDISRGLILPGRITKTSERQILVQLGESLVGAVDLIDMADDFSEANPAKFEKNEVVRAYVVYADVPNKRIGLSLRPSKVLSASLQVADPEITSFDELELNQIRRGFVTNISDKGVFVTLGHGVTAYIRIGHLSDAYLKEWKDHFQRDQLVRGKVIALDKASKQVQLSLKETVLNGEYKPPMSFNDLKTGVTVTGKIVKVETFGVFILVDNSENIRGLCHRSEIAEQRIEDVSALFQKGDVVKAKVIKVDQSNRRVNFGLKASYFVDEVDGASDEDENDEDVGGGVEVDDGDVDMDDDGDEQSDQAPVADDAETDTNIDEDESDEDLTGDNEKPTINGTIPTASGTGAGLKVGGFDWYGMPDGAAGSKRSATMNSHAAEPPAKKKKKAASTSKQTDIQVDRTGDLDVNGPQSIDDYERLLLGEPDSSLLWLQYMAFYLDLGDIDQARQIGERALKSIGLGQEAEKLNVWIALLNLENAYGDEETIEAMFQRACEYNDAQEIHTRLASIFIQSGKPKQADEMFQRITKKFAQDAKVWINYATFLFDVAEDADKARDLLPRALQMVPKYAHVDLTLKFAQLEFKSKNGLAERGRTVFEGLLNSFPKRIDLYGVLLDLEMKVGDVERVRGVFERVLTNKLKPKQAKYFFKRWLEYEEKLGDERRVDEVKARAATWVQGAGKTT